MKSISKLITGFTIMVAMIIFSSAGANAATATQVFGHKYTRGISRVTIYIDSSTYPRASYWEPRITEAVENWRYTDYGGNQFDRVYVSSNVGSQMDFHAKYKSFWGEDGSSILAETYHHRDDTSGRVDPERVDYDFAIIYINDDYYRQSSFSNTHATATLAHEMGHAFGLAHNNTNTNSIMCQTKYGRIATRVQQVDNNALNSLYY